METTPPTVTEALAATKQEPPAPPPAITVMSHPVYEGNRMHSHMRARINLHTYDRKKSEYHNNVITKESIKDFIT